MIYGLSEGRVVHFVPGENQKWLPDKERHVVGIIVKVWGREDGLVNLRLFYDGTNGHELFPLRPQDEWVTSVKYDETGTKPYSWHYPEKVV